MALNRDTVSSEQLGHLGLVAATIQELGLVDKIDSRLDFNERKGSLVSHGRRVAAMVLNGLGFMNTITLGVFQIVNLGFSSIV